jgi:hypothetical protein
LSGISSTPMPSRLCGWASRLKTLRTLAISCEPTLDEGERTLRSASLGRRRFPLA